jgi:hypothetical protein
MQPPGVETRAPSPYAATAPGNARVGPEDDPSAFPAQNCAPSPFDVNNSGTEGEFAGSDDCGKAEIKNSKRSQQSLGGVVAAGLLGKFLFRNRKL